MPLDANLAQAARATARVVALPMRVGFRGVNVRETLLFEGPEGWAEWAPFVEYTDAEAAVWLAAALDYAGTPTPPLMRERIGINATLPAVAPDAVADALAPFGTFRTVKIKVAEAGQKMADDLARIRKVRELFPAARIRLDANGGFTEAAAMQLGYRLAHDGIELDYFEQPVRELDELAKLKASLNPKGILVAADESVRKAEDPLEVARVGAADLLVIKAAPLGGITRALSVIAQAGLPAVVSSALETSVGIGMGLHLAGSIPNLEYDCGLGTVALFAEDVCDEPLMPVDGYLSVRRAVPSAEKMARLAASP
ncbi:MAG: o-succinylbenzoate synthase, partial [Actinomycetales bacterium]|nr:o-succinylbenzoate synthase [Actinomycetales bacterium]